MKFFNSELNAQANGITFKAFDRNLKHWMSSQGDDYEVDTSANLGKAKNQGYKRIRIVKHTTPTVDALDIIKEKIGDDLSARPIPFSTREYVKEDSINKRVPSIVRKLNPVLRNGFKLSRARVMAMFFVENEANYPFVGVIDGNIGNVSFDNVCWTERNIFPQLNVNYELEEIVHDITIHSSSIRVLQENMDLYGREQTFTRVNVPIQNDLLHLFKTYKIPIQSAVFTSLRLISQWSFCVYSVEYADGGKVFVGYSPLAEGVYADRIMQLSAELPWLHEIAAEEGYGVFDLKYLTMSQTRKEARASCEEFLNKYNNSSWTVMNDDFYHPDMERQLTVKISATDLEDVDHYLTTEHGCGLQKYLEAVVKKQKTKAGCLPPVKDDA